MTTTTLKQQEFFNEIEHAPNVEEIITNLLRAGQQPSALELLRAVEAEAGMQARWALIPVVEGMAASPNWTRAVRDYLSYLVETGSLARALRGEDVPDRETISTIDLLLQQSTRYRRSAAFQDMIDFMGRFREYAPYNNMLVRLQHPACGFYATARDWEDRFGRKLKEDARPMLILAPMHPVMLVYDLDQTEGDKLPEELKRFAQFKGDWQPDWLERMGENAAGYRIRVQFKPLSSTNAGFATIDREFGDWKMRIAIHDGLDEPSRCGVLCHELAHILLGHLGSDADHWWPARTNLKRNAIEVEAEAVAWIVTRRLGLSGGSEAYVSHHIRDGQTPAGVSPDSIAKVAGLVERMARETMPAAAPSGTKGEEEVSSTTLNTTTVRRWKRYPECRSSEVDWLGMIPSHWQILPLKRVAALQSGENITADSITPEGDYPVYGGNGLRGYTTAATHSGQYVLIGRQGALCGNINYAKGEFWASEHAVVVTPRLPVAVRWLGETLRTMNLGQYSISTAEPGLSVDRIIQFPIPVPSLGEQRAIAAFLDRETARIDALIGHKERLLALLEEKRQAVISHAVTRGLDPSAPLKDSTIPWLGSHPDHWKVMPIGWVAKVCNGTTPSQSREDYWEEGIIPWVSSGEVNESVISAPTALISAQAFRDTSLRMIPKGSVLMGMIGQGRTRGMSAILGIDACINQNVAAIIPGPNLENEYLLYALSHAYEPIRQVGRGGQQGTLNCELIRSIRILIPPVEEQKQIVSYLNEQNRQLTELAELLGRHNRMLQEFRTALISAAVTGQIDVRDEVSS